MSKNVMAIDQGTTGTTVVILSSALDVLGKANSEFPQIYPQPGWVEHDPEAIWTSVTETIQKALDNAGVTGDSIGAIGITNQRETTVVWERATNRPIFNAIVWQCRRTSERCDALKDAGHAETLAAKTGLVLDAYFSGTKAAWILDHVEGARDRIAELAFGTIDSFLVWRLSGEAKVHVTDISNASRTLMLNIETLNWDEELLDILNVPRSMLPEIRGNAEVYAHTSGVPGLPDGIPISGMAGDQQSALFGQACYARGEAKCTYGTGAFLLVNTGSEPVRSQHGLLTTVGWQLNGATTFVLEGSAFIAGAAVQWLRDGLGMIDTAADIEALAASVPDSGGVTFVPAFAGLGAPHWRQDARGAFFGLTRGTTRAHMARAVLEGVALQIADILRAMADDLGSPLSGLRVDGGACKNNLLMQFQADVLQTKCVRPTMIETTALGAALLAGLGAGIWNSQEELRSIWKEDRVFAPQLSDADVEALLGRWADAVGRV
jgi:glycerol kinase